MRSHWLKGFELLEDSGLVLNVFPRKASTSTEQEGSGGGFDSPLLIGLKICIYLDLTTHCHIIFRPLARDEVEESTPAGIP